MKRLIPICAIAAAMTVGLGAQDSKVKSTTKVKADDATVVSLTGCLQAAPAGHYSLVGTIAAAGEDVKTRTTVKTDVDRNDTTVKSKTKVDADDARGTTGALTTYLLIPRGSVALAPHVGHQVQVSAVMLNPGEDDAEVKIEDKTKIDRENAPDRTQRSKTKIEVEGASHGQYSVVSVKDLGTPCAN